MAHTVNHKQEAVQIARCYHQDKRSFLDVDLRALKQIIGKAPDKLIAIYCISGSQRSGKSFILNLFLQYLENSDGESDDWIETPLSQAFKYSNSAAAVTAGIWMWSEPYIIESKDGDVAVYLMDSQGWHDSSAPLADNALLFGLSTLLSSVMLYNVEKKIDEPDLQYLQNFAFNAKCVDQRTAEEPFQKLIILIRDWIFTDDYSHGFYDNCAIDGKDFINSTLRPESVESSEAKKLRELINSAYNQTSACLLPHPGDIVNTNVYDITLMHRRFRRIVVDFVNQLFSADRLVAKRLAGKTLAGAELYAEVENWINTFNTEANKSIPLYLSAYEAEFHVALQRSLDYFDNQLRANMANVTGAEQTRLLLDNLVSLAVDCQKTFDDNQRLEQLNKKLKRRLSKTLSEELAKRQDMYRIALQSKLELEKDREQTKHMQDQIRILEERAENEKDKSNDLRQQIKYFQDEIEKSRKQQEEMAARHQQQLNNLNSQIGGRRRRGCTIL